MLILVSGPSGVGKNSVISELMRRNPNLEFMKTCTTRASRAENDDSYYHISKEEFDKMIANNQLFEYENVHADLFYGTPFASLEKVIEGKKDYIKDIDVHGVKKIKDYLKGKAPLVTIFLDSPNNVLRQRLQGRGESPEMIEKRISRIEMERGFKNLYDLTLENKDIRETASAIEQFCSTLKCDKN